MKGAVVAPEQETKRAQLKHAVEDAASKYGVQRDNKAFGLEMLGIELLASEESFQSTFEGNDDMTDAFRACHAGGPSDGGLDGLIVSDDLKHVGIIQATYRMGKIDQGTVDKAHAFYAKLSEWRDPEHQVKLNSNTRQLLEGCELDPEQQEITLAFLTSESASETEQENANAVANDAEQGYRKRGWNVSCVFYTQSDILRVHKQNSTKNQAPRATSCSFKFKESNYFEYEIDEDRRALVCAISGNEIRDLYRKDGLGDNLFNTNIRSGLKAGNINPQIVKTATDEEESKHFFYFNNGITATCTSFEIKGTTVHAKNLQVVNGAQTMRALNDALRKSNPKLHVLLRVIETGEAYGRKSELADRITRFQNTQNAVKVSDFFSNDPIQQWLAERLRNESGSSTVPEFWYEHKRGVKPPGGQLGKKVTIVELAKLRYACLWGAPFTYKHAIDIFSPENSQQHYWRAFGSQGKEAAKWSDEETAEALWMIRTWLNLRATHKQIRTKTDEGGFENEALYLGVLATYTTALVFSHLKNERDDGKFTFHDIMGSEKAVTSIDSKVLSRAREAVSDEFENWLTGKKVANPRLNMPQSEETWDKLTKKLPQKVRMLVT